MGVAWRRCNAVVIVLLLLSVLPPKQLLLIAAWGMMPQHYSDSPPPRMKRSPSSARADPLPKIRRNEDYRDSARGHPSLLGLPTTVLLKSLYYLGVSDLLRCRLCCTFLASAACEVPLSLLILSPWEVDNSGPPYDEDMLLEGGSCHRIQLHLGSQATDLPPPPPLAQARAIARVFPLTERLCMSLLGVAPHGHPGPENLRHIKKCIAFASVLLHAMGPHLIMLKWQEILGICYFENIVSTLICARLNETLHELFLDGDVHPGQAAGQQGRHLDPSPLLRVKWPLLRGLHMAIAVAEPWLGLLADAIEQGQMPSLKSITLNDARHYHLCETAALFGIEDGLYPLWRSSWPLHKLARAVSGGAVPQLERFVLQDVKTSKISGFSEALAGLLSAVGTKCPKFQELSMALCETDDRQMGVVCAALPKLPELRKLELSGAIFHLPSLLLLQSTLGSMRETCDRGTRPILDQLNVADSSVTRYDLSGQQDDVERAISVLVGMGGEGGPVGNVIYTAPVPAFPGVPSFAIACPIA